MKSPGRKKRTNAIGQAIFIRTNTEDYPEETIPFRTLDEMMEICSQPRRNLSLDKVVIYAMPEGEPRALTLGFISASKAKRPGELASA